MIKTILLSAMLAIGLTPNHVIRVEAQGLHAPDHDGITGDPASCLALAQLAAVTVNLRNNGTTWEQIHAQLVQSIEESKGDPQALVNSLADQGLVIGLLEAVYQSSETDPQQVGTEVYGACMSKSHSLETPKLEYPNV
jgi:hypothetical protein